MKRWLCRLSLVLVLVSMFVSADALAQGRRPRGEDGERRVRIERSERNIRNRDSADKSRDTRGILERGSGESESGLEKDGSRHSNHIRSLPKARRR